MRIHTLQHVDFEGLGSIDDWAKAQGATVRYSRMFANDPLPQLHEFDWLVIMGGPMNIYEEDLYPWLGQEKTFIKAAIEEGKIVLGVCLGAQLIADALGAAVSRNQHKEIGWFPLSTIHPSMRAIILENTPVLHWHGDTFALPSGAERLASSAACLNQGFIFRKRVIALQFHLETTATSLSRLIEHCQDELVADEPYIQTAPELLAHADRFTSINLMMAALLDHLQHLQ
ncbi:MAG: amidotransferase [Desulfobulbaceae bacterium]|nr:amidotransferase [Desulfobulbaceae bacterium]